MASGEGGQGARGLRWNRPMSAPTFNFLFQLDPVCKLQGFFMNYESYSMPGTQMLNTTYHLKYQGLRLLNLFQNTTWSTPVCREWAKSSPKKPCQGFYRGLLARHCSEGFSSINSFYSPQKPNEGEV